MRHAPVSRRDFLMAGGALVISVMVPGAVRTALGQTPVGGKPPLTPDELDSWIAVLPDGSVRAFFGKMEPVPTVSRETLVAAIAGQRDRHVLARQLAHPVRGQR